MEYRLLGPVEVRDGDRVIPLGGAKQRTLLATLLLDAGHVVPVHRLQDAIWGEHPPKTANTQVQGLVSHLRRALGDSTGTRLRTSPPGYLLDLGEDELDLRVFDDLVAAARQDNAAGRRADAADRLRRALRLWHGAPLGGVAPTALADVEVPRLRERYLAAVEERTSVDLALGRHAELVGESRALVAEYPFRERLRGQLMLALYRSGRLAEALEVYRDGRSVLAAELGLEPGQRLRDLEEAMLAGDPVLDLVEEAEPAAVATAMPVPAQLPADIADFTGRVKQVGQLVDLLTGEDPAASAVGICVLAGKPGVGKTTLAVHCAHRVRAQFPDGQLYVNLRGAHSQPLGPPEVLERFLRALGVDGASMPELVEAKAELYRSLLAGRRMLVVLDNAVSEVQVRPLLPGTAGSAVLVTSRSRLPGLLGARQLDLDILEPEQAVELLVNLLGPERVDAEIPAAERIAELCGHLPLALRVAGAKLVARPHWTLAKLVHRLTDERGRLDELAVADIEVRASLAETCAGLGAGAARVMRLLGLVDPPDFASWVPAALADHPVPDVEELLDELVAAQLLDVVGQDATGQLRYRMHDLTRVYAHEIAEAEDPPADRDAAVRRWSGAWLSLADAALVRMPSGIPRPRHGAAPRWAIGEALTAELLAAPRVWFETEHASALAAIQQLGALGLDEATWDLAASVCSAPLLVGSLFEDWQRITDVALATVRTAGNGRGEAVLLCVLALLDYSQERYPAAAERSEQARRIFLEIGDEHSAAVGSYGLGAALHRQGRVAEATDVLAEAMATFERHDDGPALACARRHVGSLLHDRGLYDDALHTLRLALPESRQAGDQRGEGYLRYWIGLVHRATGDRDAAVADLNGAVDLLRGAGDRLGEALSTRELAAMDVEAGRLTMASVRLENCGAVFRQLRNVLGQTLTQLTMAELRVAHGQTHHALALLREAQARWAELGGLPGRIATLRRIAEIQALRDEPDAAAETTRQADALATPAAPDADRDGTGPGRNSDSVAMS